MSVQIVQTLMLSPPGYSYAAVPFKGIDLAYYVSSNFTYMQSYLIFNYSIKILNYMYFNYIVPRNNFTSDLNEREESYW